MMHYCRLMSVLFHWMHHLESRNFVKIDIQILIICTKEWCVKLLDFAKRQDQKSLFVIEFILFAFRRVYLRVTIHYILKWTNGPTI